MSVPGNLAALAGSWKGTNELYLDGKTGPVRKSESRMRVAPKANGQFIGFEYGWSFDGEFHEGLLILGCDQKSSAAQAVWTDSWHMSHTFMICDGDGDDTGRVSLTGHYSVPDQPEWGWRTEIAPGKDKFQLEMYDVAPDGAEQLAVRTEYKRE